VLGHGIRAARGRRASERNGGRGRSGRLTDTTGPKWSEIMLTARRMPCCDTMAARRRRGGAANVLLLVGPPQLEKIRPGGPTPPTRCTASLQSLPRVLEAGRRSVLWSELRSRRIWVPGGWDGIHFSLCLCYATTPLHTYESVFMLIYVFQWTPYPGPLPLYEPYNRWRTHCIESSPTSVHRNPQSLSCARVLGASASPGASMGSQRCYPFGVCRPPSQAPLPLSWSLVESRSRTSSVKAARAGLGEGSRPSRRRAQAPAWRSPRTLTWVLVSWSSGARTVEAEARTAGVSQLVIHFFYGYVLFN
jgi:hypothetical protein